MKKQAGPASVDLQSVEEFEKFINDADASVVGEYHKGNAQCSCSVEPVFDWWTGILIHSFHPYRLFP